MFSEADDLHTVRFDCLLVLIADLGNGHGPGYDSIEAQMIA